MSLSEQVFVSWDCPNCGNHSDAVPANVTVRCKCGYVDRGCKKAGPTHESMAVPPRIYKRGMNYVAAWMRWMKAGRPKRSEQVVEEYRGICSVCEWFDGYICTHVECGCSVKEASIFGDKLLWATERCPIGKWS